MTVLNSSRNSTSESDEESTKQAVDRSGGKKNLPDSDHNNTAEAATNVGDIERVLSVIGGSLMALKGLSYRGAPGLIAAAAGAALVYRGVSGSCGLYQKLGINTATDDKPASPVEYYERGIHVERSVTINKPREELFAFWRNFEQLPKFMFYLEEVTVTGDKTSHWKAKGPAGLSVSWDAEIINEIPNELIAWRSLAGARVDNTGSVRFLPGPRGEGTEVRVVIDWIPPGGQVSATIAKFFGRDVKGEVQEELRRFKQLMETGEVSTIEGQPMGTCR